MALIVEKYGGTSVGSVERINTVADNVAYGIRRWGNEELRQKWKADLDKQIVAAGLKVPDASVGRRVQ